MPKRSIPAVILLAIAVFTLIPLARNSGQSLGDLARQERERKKNAPPTTNVFTGEKGTAYMGCYVDREQRDLSAANLEADDMTDDRCQAFCQNKGFTFAATQFGKQCYCGASYGKYGKALESKCDINCPGKHEEKCGGWWANSVFRLGASPVWAAGDPPPKGAAQARPAEQLVKAWTGRSLWVRNPPADSGAVCFDFHDFKDCQIWSFDTEKHMLKKGGGMCQVSEFIVDTDDADHVPGDYGLIIGGSGATYTASFTQVVTVLTPNFSVRAKPGLSFELFDGSCASRAAK